MHILITNGLILEINLSMNLPDKLKNYKVYKCDYNLVYNNINKIDRQYEDNIKIEGKFIIL